MIETDFAAGVFTAICRIQIGQLVCLYHSISIILSAFDQVVGDRDLRKIV